MRKLQNTVSTLGNVNVRQGNQLVVRVEALRSLCASFLSALHSYASGLADRVRLDAWQGPAMTWFNEPRVGTATCLGMAIKAIVKQDQRRHEIMCHRAAA